MPITIVLGAQFGDEGKGKVVDYLARNKDMVVRFNGGSNAGHTVVNEHGEFKLHLIPAGIFYPDIACVIGNGVAVNLEVLSREIGDLDKAGISCKNLKISGLAHIVMPWHLLLDEVEEEFRGKNMIGTTKQGIGPAFADKAARKGIRMEDLRHLDKQDFQDRLYLLWQEKSRILVKVYQKCGLSLFDQIYSWLAGYRDLLLPYIADTDVLIAQAMWSHKKILLEGAQGALLDIDFGTYPNVTSSPCTSAGACQGSGIPPTKINEVIGVVKAYVTRVGSKEQPLPTEMEEALAVGLREQAHEYGATTGRPRRIGWLNAVQLRQAARVNGFTSLAITRMDNLGTLPRVKICYAYKDDGRPVYLEMPGDWGSDIESRDACDYIKIIESLVGVPVRLISYGPARNQVIVKEQ